MALQIVAAILRLVVRIFFRRIEISGAQCVPMTAAAIFAVNHPNALVDPLFLLAFAPRRVSFLAKAPLFRMPLIGWFVRAFDSIPVYRKQDNASTANNRETFARARSVLERGGAIAIFPEGTTHSDPRLRELKTGAARIALGASIRVSIVPTGLYYTAKQTFRSSALMYFGEPIAVEPWSARPEDVEQLTAQIESALAEVTLQADSHAALELIAHAERIFSAGEEVDLATELDLRKRFVAGYGYLRTHDPARLARLESQIARFDAERLAALQPISAASALRLFLLPMAMIGAVIHWPVYRAIGFLATHLASAEDEMVATLKTVGGLVLYPLLWIAAAVFAGIYFGAASAFAVLLLLPLLGFVALATFESLDEIVGRLRALRHHDTHAQQQAIREEILTVAREIDLA